MLLCYPIWLRPVQLLPSPPSTRGYFQMKATHFFICMSTTNERRPRNVACRGTASTVQRTPTVSKYSVQLHHDRRHYFGLVYEVVSSSVVPSAEGFCDSRSFQVVRAFLVNMAQHRRVQTHSCHHRSRITFCPPKHKKVCSAVAVVTGSVRYSRRTVQTS